MYLELEKQLERKEDVQKKIRQQGINVRKKREREFDKSGQPNYRAI